MIMLPELPTDPQSPDYARKLDEGFAMIEKSDMEASQERKTLFDEFESGLLRVLAEQGFSPIKQGPLDETRTRLPCGRVLEIKAGAYLCTFPNDPAKRIAFEYLVNRHEIESQQTLLALTGAVRNLNTLYAGFVMAACALTKVQPLISEDILRERAFFFFPRQEGVYTTGISVKEPPDEGILSLAENLHPDLFQQSSLEVEDGLELAGFGVRTDTNLYVVTNPSKKLPVQEIAGYAIPATSERLMRERQAIEKRRETEGTLGQRLASYLAHKLRVH